MFRILLLGSVVVGIWSSTWVVMRAAIAHQHLSIEALSLGRNLFASLFFAVALCWRRPPPLQRGEVLRLATAGILGLAIYNLLTGWGQRSVDGGPAAVIIQTAPVWTALGGWWLLKQPVGPGVWLGMGAAVIGMVCIGLGRSAGTGGTLPDLAMLFAASLTFAAYNLLMQPVAARIGGWWATAWAVWFATLVLLPFSGHVVSELQTRPWLVLAFWGYMGLFATAIAYATWIVIAAALPLARAAVFLYLVPVLALVLGWVILGERPSNLGFVGAGCILAGVIVAQRMRR
jgi:drug/metabolite transporter (DMT)-like permease